MKKYLVILLSHVMVMSLLTGCGQTANAETILVAAAASLKNVYENELIPRFEASHKGVKVEVTFASSGQLQTQIEEGMEADVFMSASVKQMNALIEEGIIESADNHELLINELVLITPIDSKLEISGFEDIVNADTIAIGDPESVPAGQYAKEAFTNLKLWDSIKDKLSLGKDVTEVLNQVAERSADCGIVYATDAASMGDKVKIIATAPRGSLAKEVIYPVAVVKGSAKKSAANAFVEFLQTKEAQDVFVQYGFKINVAK